MRDYWVWAALASVALVFAVHFITKRRRQRDACPIPPTEPGDHLG
jgi:hypothetical protein